jgi:3-oxoacyl-[acyl-carrier-protein] synthase II
VSDSPVITGIGLSTPLGRGAQETWRSLLARQTIRDHSRLEPLHNQHLPRVSALAIEAANEAITEAGWHDHSGQTALIVGTSKGPIEDWIAPPPSNNSKSDKTEPAGRLNFGLASVATDVADALKLTGPRLTVSAACASGLHALIRAVIMLRSGEAERVLVVAAEASVHPLFLGSFQRLGVLPPPGELCRPFDVHRQGFLMSEAAAAVCIKMQHFAPFSRQSGVFVDRFALAGDATHMTAGDPSGTTLQRLLMQVTAKQSVDLIHAHGTGTELNDVMELHAINQSIGPSDEPPIIYSHKGALGHSLGAAGLAAVVINVMCHRNGCILANPNTIEPMPSIGIISTSTIERPIRRSVAVGAGFGGPLAVVGLSGL